jgi:hypothetical protein
MKIPKSGGDFENCPEFMGQAVCVDVTPLKRQDSQFGERMVFRIVFEVNQQRDDGKPFCVWSKPFTPTLNEKANLRKFIRQWYGRDLTAAEMEDFETEDLVGRPAMVSVVHVEHDGKTFANIAACTPDKSGAPIEPSGTFVRAKDRPDAVSTSAPGPAGGGSGGGYRRAAQPAAETKAGVVDHASVKVHVGKFKGHELRDLAPEHVEALITNWLPVGKALAKPLADDKRLIAALEWFIGAERRRVAAEAAAAKAAVDGGSLADADNQAADNLNY